MNFNILMGILKFYSIHSEALASFQELSSLKLLGQWAGL